MSRPEPTKACQLYVRGIAKHVRSKSLQDIVAEYAAAIPAYDAGWIKADRTQEQNAATVRV